MTTREELHRIVDHIPDDQLPTTEKLLRSLVGPVELALALVEEDNEPESDDEREALEAALSDCAPDIPFEGIRRVRH